MWCIPKHLVNDFLDRLKKGEITPDKMKAMSSEERRKYFSEFLGEANAIKVNTALEQKLILKNWKKGVVNWAKQNAGLTPEVRKDIISKVDKMETILNEKQQDAFLADLVAHRLGANVTMAEAANLSSLAKDAIQKRTKVEGLYKAKPNYDITKESPEDFATRMEYGAAKVEFDDYFNKLKDESERIKLQEYLLPKNWGRAVSEAAGFSKAVIASFDDSVIGRQGLKTLTTNPDIWAKNSVQSVKDLIKVIVGGDKKAMKAIRAEILSRPNAVNGNYRKYGVDVGVREEAYPTSFPERLPVLGRFFKGSEIAFTAWQYRTRADLFDRVYALLEKSGGDPEGLGLLVNEMTGRGGLGGLEPVAGVLNKIMFSVRFFKSNIDFLTAHVGDKKMSPELKKKAAQNLALAILAVGTVLSVANAIDDNSVEFDPRSSDFGKIRIRNTRFDITAGMASIITLISRITPTMHNGKWGLWTKNSNTKIYTELNQDKFGAKTGWDVLMSFAEGKASPYARAFIDYLSGKDFKGRKPTVATTAQNLYVPIPVTNFNELKDDPNAAPLWIALLLDGIGFGQNTYGLEVDWDVKTSEKMNAFRETVSKDDFKSANKEFNTRFAEWMHETNKDSTYLELTDDDKLTVISREKTKLEEQVMKEYGFKYKPEKKKLPKF